MSILIDISSELEEKLRATASAAGVRVDDYIVNVLEKNILTEKADFQSKEIRLLQKINQGFAPETWVKFHDLLQKRDARTISDLELAELIELTETIELAHAQRMEALVELATLQNKPLLLLMNELGISPVAYGTDEEN
jgi:response regulator RpfG family c-di-GMP phosphodiesterase